MATKSKAPGKLEIEETFFEVQEVDLGPDHGWDEKRYLLGESGPYEPFTDNLGKLFKSLRREYGACVSKVYLDAPDGRPFSIGWVFKKKMEYEDAARLRSRGENPFYVREVWVTYRYV